MASLRPFRILVLNQVSDMGLQRLPAGRYLVGKDVEEPDAVLVRSADMHAMQMPDSVQAIARAGAGTNNIPVKAMSARGVPVFNAPGANANAVKELVLAAMLMAARNLAPAQRFVQGLDPAHPELDKTVDMSSTNTGMWLNLAINYGGRAELVDAVQAIGREIAAGRMTPGDVDEHAITSRLYTAGLDDPDLLVRTAGELRISNFLLWQVSYAEIWVTERCWPEFDEATLHEAIRDFASRNRKYGGLNG